MNSNSISSQASFDCTKIKESTPKCTSSESISPNCGRGVGPLRRPSRFFMTPSIDTCGNVDNKSTKPYTQNILRFIQK